MVGAVASDAPCQVSCFEGFYTTLQAYGIQVGAAAMFGALFLTRCPTSEPSVLRVVFDFISEELCPFGVDFDVFVCIQCLRDEVPHGCHDQARSHVSSHVAALVNETNKKFKVR